MACRPDRRWPNRRAGQGFAVSWRLQRLDHADQGAHRHARDRNSHADRHQGSWKRPDGDGEAGTADRNGCEGSSGHLERYGLMVSDVQDTVSSALGGETITTTVEGRERYGVNLRYPRDLRSDPQSIARDVLVAMPGGGTVPLGEVATIKLTRGPTSIRTENGQLAVYIFVDIRDRDLGGYVADAKAAVAASVQFPPGNYVVW